MSTDEATIRQLEKRASGFRRLISSLNDLSIYGINPTRDKILFVRISELKEHLKKKITKNNERLNDHYTTSIDSLSDDDGQVGVVGKLVVDDTTKEKLSVMTEDEEYRTAGITKEEAERKIT
jgi:hypothetical protein